MAEQDNIFKRLWKGVKKFYKFLKKDTWGSFIVTLILAFVIIKYVFFPLLSLITGTALPLVIVESCSMYHSDGLEEIFKEQCDSIKFNRSLDCEESIYSQYGVEFDEAGEWSFQNGLNKGDIMFVLGVDSVSELEVGDVVIFSPNGAARHPIIHRVIDINDDEITTKGDNNYGLLETEQNIPADRIIGKAVFRIHYIGWAKLIFFEHEKPVSERGLCS